MRGKGYIKEAGKGERVKDVRKESYVGITMWRWGWRWRSMEMRCKIVEKLKIEDGNKGELREVMARKKGSEMAVKKKRTVSR